MHLGVTRILLLDLIYDTSQCNFIKENIPDKIIVLSDFTDIDNRLLSNLLIV